MSDLSPYLLVLLLIAGAVAFVMYRRTTALESELRAEQKNLKEKKDDAEKARAQNRERGAELEQLRKQLQDYKSKLKRLQKDQHTQRKAEKATGQDDEAPSIRARSAASTVRVTDQALQAEHNRAIEGLRKKLASAEKQVEQLRAAEAKRKADADAAAKSIASDPDDATSTQATTAAAAATPEEQVAALQTQLEAFRRAASQQEKKTKRDLKKAEARANAAHRRANSSHNLYLMIKAQLELTADRLAMLKRKYEGAMPPEALRPDKPANGAIDEAAAVVAEAEAQAAEAEEQAAAEEVAAGLTPQTPEVHADQDAEVAEAGEAESAEAEPVDSESVAEQSEPTDANEPMAADATSDPGEADKPRAEPQG